MRILGSHSFRTFLKKRGLSKFGLDVEVSRIIIYHPFSEGNEITIDIKKNCYYLGYFEVRPNSDAQLIIDEPPCQAKN